jgi:hypothetical protein
MKRTKIADSLRFFTASSLMLVLFAGASFVLAAPVNRGRAAEISVSGEGENGAKPFLKLNGEPVLSGRTFFSYSTLETPASVSADVNLPGLGRVSLSPGTMLSLGFSENNITGKLHAGKIRVFSTAGTKVDIETPDNRLVNDPAIAGTFILDMTSGVSKTVAEKGSVFLDNGEPAPQTQTAGASASIWVPVVVYSAIVGTAVVVVLLDRMSDDDNAEDAIVSQIR